MTPYHTEPRITLYHGDCLEVLPRIAPQIVDAIVTDPPYGLSFMGKRWDYDVPGVEVWEECLRVLRPGGHLLAFSGSRTYHRMVVNMEDAGFEIRDQIMWIYGSGFPKSLDIGKAIDKAAGAERTEILGRYKPPGMEKPWNLEKAKDERTVEVFASSRNNLDITAPATPEAKEWDGWGTALKPAHEPIVLARKPLEGTVAENVLRHGTGGLNIDGGRIGTQEVLHGGSRRIGDGIKYGKCEPSTEYEQSRKGRFPSNVILDPEAGAMLDEQSGELKSGANPERRGSDKCREAYGEFRGQETCTPMRGAEVGGASRFFYCAKASKADRDEGLEGMPKHEVLIGAAGHKINPMTGKEVVDIPRANHHPTVKPTDLMRYLVRLITPPGGTVLDPFGGTMSTGKACLYEGFGFIGIEREAEYCEIGKHRLRIHVQQVLV